MRVESHLLFGDDGAPVPVVRTPNQGGAYVPRYLVMHYTAGSSAEGTIEHFADKDSKVSAHLVIGRDGAITQMVPFNRIAWHAGRSRWHDLVGLNRYAIGIELDNAGVLEGGPGEWRAWFGTIYPDSEVVIARHMQETVERGWHRFTEAQIAAALAAGRAVVEFYGLLDVLGHDQIAPGRKLDPGPAFPMESFRSRLMGRADDRDVLFETVVQLNIREGPGTRYAQLDGSPLAKGTRLRADGRDGAWLFVEVLHDDGDPDNTGWVHGGYVAPLIGRVA